MQNQSSYFQRSEPKDVVYLTNTQNWVWGPTFSSEI